MAMMPLSHRLLGSAAATFDRAVVAAIQMKNRGVRARPEALGHDERMRRLGAIRDTYGAAELVATADAYFEAPPAIRPVERVVRALPWGGTAVDLAWPSHVEPFAAEMREGYLAHSRNRTAYARLFAGPTPRPAAILVHGYMAGQWTLEERAWPVRWMNAHGLDVAIVLLPFHALRGDPGAAAPPFPGADPRLTNEGFRQAIGDIRALARHLRERGAPLVGAMGMSLGGYTTSLLATVERELAFAVPIIPLASVADFARDQGRLGTSAQAELQHAALEDANRVVSPFARPSLVPKERVLVIGATADRITPIAHAERIARHFDAPLVRFHGGHLLQFGRAHAFREVRRMLERTGIVGRLR
jgi:dienelactone hydrolase